MIYALPFLFSCFSYLICATVLVFLYPVFCPFLFLLSFLFYITFMLHISIVLLLVALFLLLILAISFLSILSFFIPILSSCALHFTSVFPVLSLSSFYIPFLSTLIEYFPFRFIFLSQLLLLFRTGIYLLLMSIIFFPFLIIVVLFSPSVLTFLSYLASLILTSLSFLISHSSLPSSSGPLFCCISLFLSFVVFHFSSTFANSLCLFSFFFSLSFSLIFFLLFLLSSFLALLLPIVFLFSFNSNLLLVLVNCFVNLFVQLLFLCSCFPTTLPFPLLHFNTSSPAFSSLVFSFLLSLLSHFYCSSALCYHLFYILPVTISLLSYFSLRLPYYSLSVLFRLSLQLIPLCLVVSLVSQLLSYPLYSSFVLLYFCCTPHLPLVP